MHFRKALNPDHLGADDFVDHEMNPIKRNLTIKRVFMAKPPAGKKEKICIEFQEDHRTAFLANKQVKQVARLLRRAETEMWIGAVVQITSGPVKAPGTKDEMTTGMIVLNAAFRKSQQAQTQQQGADPGADATPASQGAANGE